MARFLSGRQYALVSAVLDRLIPPQDTMPGAGQLGVADYLDGIAAQSPPTRAPFLRRPPGDIEIAATQTRPQVSRDTQTETGGTTF